MIMKKVGNIIKVNNDKIKCIFAAHIKCSTIPQLHALNNEPQKK